MFLLNEVVINQSMLEMLETLDNLSGWIAGGMAALFLFHFAYFLTLLTQNHMWKKAGHKDWCHSPKELKNNLLQMGVILGIIILCFIFQFYVYHLKG